MISIECWLFCGRGKGEIGQENQKSMEFQLATIFIGLKCLVECEGEARRVSSENIWQAAGIIVVKDAGPVSRCQDEREGEGEGGIE